MDELSALALGTAQLTRRYGLAHRGAPGDEATAFAVLDAAYSWGIRLVDTAPSYGSSEAVVGRWLAARGHGDVRLVGKLDASVDHRDADAVAAAARASTGRVGRSFAAFLLHDPEALEARADGTEAALRRCVDEGLADRVGASVYAPDALAAALELDLPLAIECPTNALDRRFAEGGFLEAARARGALVLVRSVFLQGLLVLDPDELPGELTDARPALESWRRLCVRFGLTSADAAVLAARALAPGAVLIVGAERPEQVEASARAFASETPDGFEAALESLPAAPEHVVDPRSWTSVG